MSPRPYDGKLGIVTGGSRGIGAAVAKRLAAKGCNLLLVFTSDSSKDLVQALCAELYDQHRVSCAQVQADLSQAGAACEKIVAAARGFHASLRRDGELQVDILINNAGVSSNQFLNDADKGPIAEAEFARVYNVNVLAPLLLTQALAPYFPRPTSPESGSFVKTKGRVVNVSSVSSSIGYEGQSVYAGTKAALEAMTRCWSRELAGRATAGEKFWRINQAYCDAAPLQAYTGGSAETAAEVKELMGDGTQDKDAELQRFDSLVREKMGGRRPGFTSEIAGTIDMLCSEEAGWTTGSVVCANGGMKMSIA
ncbi:3-oxoacyl- reductase [Apiospora hydei]|uniref:3-oxoacyl- reductase n=1 Tax=Apiospora hydei TaxID=1337664 RepID=A0ABR1WPJ1_9PEZI